MGRLSEVLLGWYDENKRDLPWRNTTDPYLIWLSEIILQQTRIEQGLSYYENFKNTFPSITALANAPEDAVLRLWQGLGYYSRARNLHFTAKHIAFELGGVFPEKYNDIIKLKGIGDYTASAISSFSFKEPQPVLDGNVFRFISRYYNIEDDIALAKSRKVFKEILYQEIDEKQPDIFNQAIMDFGSVQCAVKNPSCGSCPFNATCYAFINKAQEKLPVKIKKLKRRSRYFYYHVITDGTKYLMNKRPNNGIWAGLYEFPLIESDKPNEDFNPEIEWLKLLRTKSVNVFEPKKKHVLSHQDIYAHFFLIRVEKLMDSTVYSLEEIKLLPKHVLIENFLRENVYK